MKNAPRALAQDELPPQPQQQRSIARRQRLLDAARKLFAENGYGATSIEDIASRAGAASGAFYLYFRSKRQLLLVLVDELMQSIESLELARDTNLRRFLGRALREDRRHYGVVRAFHEVCASDPELSALRERIERWTSRRILKFFEQLAKHPRARRNLDLQPFAQMMDRHFWSLLARAASLSPRAFQRELDLAASVIEHYLWT